ncbi:MAG: hypothetical protein ABIQ16_12415 [Polyangiaceae bacterium]
MTDVRRRATLAALLAILVFDTTAAQSEPAAPSVSPERAAHLATSLTRLADANRWSAGDTVLDLSVGAALMGFGTYFAFSREAQEGNGTSRGFAVALSVLAGSGLFARGVYSLGGVTSESEMRLERFNKLREKGALNEIELARFEAQFELEATQARSKRRWSAVSSIGGAAAGAGLMVLGATSRLRGPARDVMYYEGGGLFAVETAFAIYELSRESGTEREWRDYQSKQAARTSSVRLQLAPVLAPHVASLLLIGRF